MIVNIENYTDRNRATIAEFEDMADYLRIFKGNKYHKTSNSDRRAVWAGGTRSQFEHGCVWGDETYTKYADELIDKYSNLAIEDYVRSLEYNPHVGVLDYEAAMAGEVNCMYGTVIEQTDKSPIVITVDSWVSSTVSPESIKWRGIAVLALARALTVFRPVQVLSVSGAKHNAARRDVIQIVPIPSNPLDVNMAGFILASPMFTRIGQMDMMHLITRENRRDPIGLLAAGRSWQYDDMGEWVGKRMGINNVVHLPMMFGQTAQWDKHQCEKWVMDQMRRFMPK